jgi:hypothetical protein
MIIPRFSNDGLIQYFERSQFSISPIEKNSYDVLDMPIQALDLIFALNLVGGSEFIVISAIWTQMSSMLHNRQVTSIFDGLRVSTTAVPCSLVYACHGLTETEGRRSISWSPILAYMEDSPRSTLPNEVLSKETTSTFAGFTTTLGRSFIHRVCSSQSTTVV